MKINGFQKMTLLDYPGKVACTVFCAGCNFRCPFCHNAALVTHIDNENSFSEQEILEYLKKRRGLLDGVCITGGEPLLNPDIAEFLGKIKQLGFSVKVDTNGSFPDRLIEIVNAGLVDYIAMDVKNSKEKYVQTADVSNLEMENIQKSIDFLLGGKVDFEFRTTVVKEFHTVEDIEEIAKWIKGAPRYFLQNFVDSGDLICGNLTPVSSDVLCKMQQKSTQYVSKTEIRGI